MDPSFGGMNYYVSRVKKKAKAFYVTVFLLPVLQTQLPLLLFIFRLTSAFDYSILCLLGVQH
jgi:hypothetical protein